MEDPLNKFAKHDEMEPDTFKHSGSEEDDIGYHSIGRNIKVMALTTMLKTFSWHRLLMHRQEISSKFSTLACSQISV